MSTPGDGQGQQQPGSGYGQQPGGGYGQQSGGGYGPPPGGGPPPGYAPPAGETQWGGAHGAPAQAPRNGMGTAALVLAILAVLSLTIVWVPFLGLLTVLLGLLATIFGVIGRKRVKRLQASNGGVAMTGLVLGVLTLLVGLVVQAFVIITTVVFLQSGGGESLQQFQQCLQQAQSAGSPAEVQQGLEQCQQQFAEQLPQFGGEIEGDGG